MDTLTIDLDAEGHISLDLAILTARACTAGEPRTLWRAKIGEFDAICVCPDGEPVFYMRHADVPPDSGWTKSWLLAGIPEAYRWRIAVIPTNGWQELAELTDAIVQAPPDPVLAKRAWTITDIVRVHLTYPDPPPTGERLVPILNVPIGVVDGHWRAPSPSKSHVAEGIAIVEFGRFQPHAFWSRVDVPRGASFKEVVTTELERLEKAYPSLCVGVVAAVEVGPSFMDMRWMTDRNAKRVQIMMV